MTEQIKSSGSLLEDRLSISKQLAKEAEKFSEIEGLLSKERRIVLELKKQTSCNDGQVLINCDASNNRDVFLALMNCAFEKNLIPVFVLTTTNYKSILNFFKDAGIDSSKFFIFDTVSKNIINIHDHDNLFFVESLRSLTQLQIKLLNFISKQKNAVIVFDSVDVMTLYHKEPILLKFIYTLIKLFHKQKINGFYLLNNSELIHKIGQFFDNIIEIDRIE